MRETLDRGRNTYSPALLTLLESRMEQCQISLEKLQKGLAVLDPGLVPTHETLVSILRSTSAVNTRSKVCFPLGIYNVTEILIDALLPFSSPPQK